MNPQAARLPARALRRCTAGVPALVAGVFLALAGIASAQTWRDLLDGVDSEPTEAETAVDSEPTEAETAATDSADAPAPPEERTAEDLVQEQNTTAQTDTAQTDAVPNEAVPPGMPNDEPGENQPVDMAPGNESLDTTVAALSDADCFKELASIDYGHWSETLEDNRFQHVFQHVDDYPYYRYAGSAFIGIKTRRFLPSSRRPGRSYWWFVDGRQGVGADGHYSLIQDFAGKTVVEGVSVHVTKSNEFAFFGYDRSASSGRSYLASDAKKGLFDVLTTTPNGVEFVGIWSTRSRRGSASALRLRSPRFLDNSGEWDESY